MMITIFIIISISMLILLNYYLNRPLLYYYGTYLVNAFRMKSYELYALVTLLVDSVFREYNYSGKVILSTYFFFVSMIWFSLFSIHFIYNLYSGLLYELYYYNVMFNTKSIELGTESILDELAFEVLDEELILEEAVYNVIDEHIRELAVRTYSKSCISFIKALQLPPGYYLEAYEHGMSTTAYKWIFMDTLYDWFLAKTYKDWWETEYWDYHVWLCMLWTEYVEYNIPYNRFCYHETYIEKLMRYSHYAKVDWDNKNKSMLLAELTVLIGISLLVKHHVFTDEVYVYRDWWEKNLFMDDPDYKK